MTHGAYDQRELLLATLPPSQRQVRTALIVVLMMLVLFGVTVRYVNVDYPALTPSFQFLQPRRSSMISLPRSCCSLSTVSRSTGTAGPR